MGLNYPIEVQNQFTFFLPNTPLRAHCVIFIVNYYHVGLQGDVGQEVEEEDQEG